MAKLPYPITEDEFAKWMLPKDAVALLKSHYGTQSIIIATTTLIERAKGGLLTAIAKHTSYEDGTTTYLKPIQKSDWDSIRSDSTLWLSGDVVYRIKLGSYRDDAVTVRQFDVRFHPQEVRDIIPAPMMAEPDKPAAAGEQPGPPVSDAHLKAWYELYKKAYPDDSEDRAWQSARGMFPGKSVSRAKIRELRGSRDMGRPSRE
jgi:hypothetical protein